MSTYKRFKYKGPTYYNGNKISIDTEMFTMARTFQEAYRNFLFKVANGDYISRYDIVPDHIIEVNKPKKIEHSEPINTECCTFCGAQLNEMGKCPVCDYGEEDY